LRGPLDTASLLDRNAQVGHFSSSMTLRVRRALVAQSRPAILQFYVLLFLNLESTYLLPKMILAASSFLYSR